jgi:O-antigen/teichoic acid export membrane protein
MRRDLVVTTLSQVAVAVGGLLLYRLLALEKGAEGVASYALVKQAVIFLMPAVSLGFETGVPRYVALGRDEEGAGERYLLAALALTGITCAVVSVALLVSPPAAASLFFGDDGRTHLVLPLVATLVATLTWDMVFGYYRGRSEFLMVSVARMLTVAALPVVLLIVIPDEPIGDLISLMAIGVLVPHLLLALRPVARAVRPLRPERVLDAGRTLLDYGRRRIPGDTAAVVLMTVPPLLAVHFAPLREVGYLTVGLYVIAVVTIAFGQIGLIFLPLLSRLCKEDFAAASRWVSKLAACALHIAIFATPQLLLFTDVAMQAWLGEEFEPAGPIIRITVAPVALYLFYLVLRSALDAAAVKAYNSRNNLLALLAAAVAATVSLALGLGEPATAIAASFALGIACLGALTLASAHSIYRLDSSEYALRTSLTLSLAAAGAGLAVRLTVVDSDASLLTVAALGLGELGLGALYLAGLVRAGVTWPLDIRDRFMRRAA